MKIPPISKLVLRTGKTLLDALLGLGATASESLLELLGVRGGDEDVAGVDGGGLDLLDALHFDVEDDDLALGCLLLDGCLTRSVKVATKLGAARRVVSVCASLPAIDEPTARRSRPWRSSPGKHPW
ncbi:hypothetical protein HG531_006566 [Fusarium graminearum]|nr:hypothetical protein HG531_006566 [Fusarium graminearum]